MEQLVGHLGGTLVIFDSEASTLYGFTSNPSFLNQLLIRMCGFMKELALSIDQQNCGVSGNSMAPIT